MAVEIKVKKSDESKNEIVNFSKEDHRAVKGLKGSFFVDKVVVVHKVQAEKLVKAKLAEIVKADLVEVKTNNRINTDAPEN